MAVAWRSANIQMEVLTAIQGLDNQHRKHLSNQEGGTLLTVDFVWVHEFVR
jgi:hypothetical protein